MKVESVNSVTVRQVPRWACQRRAKSGMGGGFTVHGDAVAEVHIGEHDLGVGDEEGGAGAASCGGVEGSERGDGCGGVN